MSVHSYDAPFIKGKYMKDSIQEQLIAAGEIRFLMPQQRSSPKKAFIQPPSRILPERQALRMALSITTLRTKRH